MAGKLAGKLALVTGAGSGIGKAVCELFSKEGAAIVGAGLQDVTDTVQSLPKLNDNIHLDVSMNVSSEEDVSKMFQTILQKYNRPPCIVINCAGITKDGFLIKMSETDFDDVIDVNLKGTFFVIKHLCPLLMKHKVSNASIVNIASIVGKTGNIGQANYTASKAGVVGLTKTSALEFARYGIRCNAILPGFIKTPMTNQVPDKVQEGVRSMIPLQKFGEPIDVAKACLFLASDESRYITATTLEVAGGLGA